MLIEINKEVECWFPVKGFERHYEVSNLGRVKSIKKNKTCSENKIIKPLKNYKGYLQFKMSINGNSKTVRVHRVVCDAFKPESSFEGAFVNHINGDKADNRIENLKWITNSDNLIHGYRVLGRKKNETPVLQYDLNNNFIEKHKSIREASKKTNSDETCISKCIHGAIKSTNNFKWERA